MQEWVPTSEHVVKILAVYLVVLLLAVLYVKRLLGLLCEFIVVLFGTSVYALVEDLVEALKSCLFALLAWLEAPVIDDPADATQPLLMSVLMPLPLQPLLNPPSLKPLRSIWLISWR